MVVDLPHQLALGGVRWAYDLAVRDWMHSSIIVAVATAVDPIGPIGVAAALWNIGRDVCGGGALVFLLLFAKSEHDCD